MTAINIPDDVLERVVRAAHATTPQEAVLKALEEFARRHDQSQLIRLLGTFDDMMTPEELQEMRGMD
jgi:hypothetical protein